jgi:RimJ/RimL family protein N-acetyltransferase
MAPSSRVSIRVAGLDDFEAWFGLYDAVATEGKWIGGETPSDREGRRRSFEAYLKDEDAVSFLAEADGQVIGALGAQIRRGLAELGMMVDARWRGRGVGSSLMEACIAWAREHGAHKIVLTVWPHNTAARALYRKYGFEEEATLRRHYRRRNGELWDAIGMGLVLDRDAPGSPY